VVPKDEGIRLLWKLETFMQDWQDYSLLGCEAMFTGNYLPVFWGSLLPLSSGYLSSAVKTSNHAWYYFKYFIPLLVCCVHYPIFLLSVSVLLNISEFPRVQNCVIVHLK